MIDSTDADNAPMTPQEIYSCLHAKQEPMVSKYQAAVNLRGVAKCREALAKSAACRFDQPN